MVSQKSIINKKAQKIRINKTARELAKLEVAMWMSKNETESLSSLKNYYGKLFGREGIDVKTDTINFRLEAIRHHKFAKIMAHNKDEKKAAKYWEDTIACLEKFYENLLKKDSIAMNDLIIKTINKGKINNRQRMLIDASKCIGDAFKMDAKDLERAVKYVEEAKKLLDNYQSKVYVERILKTSKTK